MKGQSIDLSSAVDLIIKEAHKATWPEHDKAFLLNCGSILDMIQWYMRDPKMVQFAVVVWEKQSTNLYDHMLPMIQNRKQRTFMRQILDQLKRPLTSTKGKRNR